MRLVLIDVLFVITPKKVAVCHLSALSTTPNHDKYSLIVTNPVEPTPQSLWADASHDRSHTLMRP